MTGPQHEPLASGSSSEPHSLDERSVLWFDWQSESSAPSGARCAVVDEANDSAARLLGARTAAELRGLPLSGLFARESWPAIERELAQRPFAIELLGRGTSSVRARARLLAPGQRLRAGARTLLVCPAEPKLAAALVCRRLARGALHDLRSPMMAISGFADVLAFRHAAELGPDARRCVDNIAAAAKRMEHMLELLASETRLGSGELELRPLDLRELLRGSGEFPEHAQRLPVHGDRLVLRAAFAEWFAHVPAGASIEITSVGGRARVRLPVDSSLDLPLARRAIELHGGRIVGHAAGLEIELPLQRGTEGARA